MHRLITFDCSTCRLKTEETESGVDAPFDEPMVLLDEVVEIFTLSQLSAVGEGSFFLQRAKSRVLLDVMSQGNLEIQKAMTANEKEEEQRLNRKITELNNEMTDDRLKQSPNDSRLNQLAAQLDDARLKYAAFRNVLFASHPDLKLQLGQLPPLKLTDLNGLTADHKTAFLEYVIADDHVYLFVLTKNAQQRDPDLRVHSILMKRSELARRIERIHHQWRSPITATG